MSLKEHTKEIYGRYGLTDEEFQAYLIFLGYPQFTVSEVAGVLGKEEPSEIQTIADKLESLNFIKKIPGIIDRYIPLEPYLEMFNKESATFREEISQIKDSVLMDQSSRFENLDDIENSGVQAINTSVSTQIDAFFKESDTNDVDKKNVIDSARSRFDTTSSALMGTIQNQLFESRDKFTNTRTAFSDEIKTKTHASRDLFESTTKEVENNIQSNLFAGRDRFETTGKELEKHLQAQLFAGRDRFETTSKTLESDLHTHIDTHDKNVNDSVNLRHNDSAKVWDSNTQKFTSDNSALNAQLTDTSAQHVSHTQSLEKNLHSMVDSLNSQLKEISEGFKSKFDGGIQEQKGTLNKIVDDLLKDFADRVGKLEIECKKDLDEHVEHHKEHADGLKPDLEEILDKYILRMKKVVESLKNEFSSLLANHVSTFDTTSGKLRDEINTKLDSRHADLAGQVLEFKKNTVGLIDNLKDTSDRYSELAEDLAKRGSAWKALLFGKHKIFQERYTEIQDRIGSLSGNMKSNFENSTAKYIEETGETTNLLKTDLDTYVSKKNQEFKKETDSLDGEQKEKLEAELEGLANDLSSEINDNLQHNIKHCQDTTVKLKDSVENSLHTHHEEYEFAINKYRQTGLGHNDECNTNVNEKIKLWYDAMDQEHRRIKSDASNEIAAQISDINDHLKKSTDKNTLHSADFERDVKDVKTEQRRIFDDLIRSTGDDFRNCKTNISEKINAEINLIKGEVKDMDDYAHQKVDDQINLFKTETQAMNEFQHQKLDTQMALFRQEVDAINAKQQQEIDTHIQTFKDLIATLDDKQHVDLTAQKDLFTAECNTMEEKLHSMLEKHKAEYNENATNLQQDLSKTIETNIQDTKDAIADFTLNFMNAIDTGFENAEENEMVLTDIKNAAMQVVPLGNSATWHVFGTKALLGSIIAAMHRTKSTITIVTPSVEPKILEALSQVAYMKKSARFLYTTSWDMATFGEIVQKMKVLGNIQFRNLKNANDFYAVSRDGEEIVLCPQAKDEKDLIAIVSVQEGYAQIFGSFIYPIFQANSRPI